MKKEFKMKKKGMIVVDPKKCVACRTCELQCAVAHSKSKDIMKAIFEKPLPKPRIKVEGTAELVMPLQCRHCEDAPCVEVCPTKAIERHEESGPVLINQERCIGCKWCVLVCPFGSISVDAEGKKVTKCDLCVERLEKNDLPACVSGCPTGALQFRGLKEIASEKRKDYLVKFKKGDEIV